MQVLDIGGELREGGVSVTWKPMKLTLKRHFTTAHSSSDYRTNFLVRVKVEGREEVGWGECGLPLKEPHCYLADIHVCN